VLNLYSIVQKCRKRNIHMSLFVNQVLLRVVIASVKFLGCVQALHLLKKRFHFILMVLLTHSVDYK